MNFGAVKDLWFRFPNGSAAARDSAGLTPMHIAAKNGDRECLTFLLTKGQDLNAVDNERNTPLHYAVSGNFIKCMQLLIERNCDESIENSQGQNAW